MCWVRRKFRSMGRWFKRKYRSVKSRFQRNSQDISEEVTETVLDVDSPSFRRLGKDTELPDWMIKSDPPSSSSSGGSSHSSGSGYSSHSSGGGGCGPDLDGCFDGCSGCDGCALDLVLIPLALYKVYFYNTRGYPWYKRHEHNHRT